MKSPEEIKVLQQGLNKLLKVDLKITGVVDPATSAAIKSYQYQKGLPLTGQVDDMTDKALHGDLIAKGLEEKPQKPKPKPVPKPDPKTDPIAEAKKLIQEALTLLEEV